MIDSITDKRLTYLRNEYLDFKSNLDRKLITQVEYDQKLKSLEDQCIAIWGTTSLFYTFLNSSTNEQHQS